MSTTAKTPERGRARPAANHGFRARRWLRFALTAGCLLFLLPASFAAAAEQRSPCPALVDSGMVPAGYVQREQDVFPTRTTGVAHFYNLTNKEITFEIGGQWHNLHAGSRYQPYETWVELLPGEYAYHAYALDGSEIHGSTRVFQTITWPVAIGEPYQEPPPPLPVGPYAPPPGLGTLVLRNLTNKEMTILVQDEGFPLHTATASGPYETIRFVQPGEVLIRVMTPTEVVQQILLVCGGEPSGFDDVLFTRTVRAGQTALWEAFE